MNLFVGVSGHALNHEADLARAQERPIRSILDAAASVPDSVDWRGLSDVLLDQARSESCVWHGFAMAVFLRSCWEHARGIGDVIPVPSPMQGWVLAQLVAQELAGVPAEQRVARNVGSSLSAGLIGLHRFGVASALRCPLDPRLGWDADPTEADAATFDMPIDVDQAASVAKLTGDYGASGEDFPLVARAALAQGQFPVQAFDVCEDFLMLRPGKDEYRGTEDRPIIGRHLMVVDGSRPGWLRYRGSYGSGWGTDGWIWVADDYTASPQARDGAVITAVPRVR